MTQTETQQLKQTTLEELKQPSRASYKLTRPKDPRAWQKHLEQEELRLIRDQIALNDLHKCGGRE